MSAYEEQHPEQWSNNLNEQVRTRIMWRWFGVIIVLAICVIIGTDLSYQYVQRARLIDQVPVKLRDNIAFPLYVSAQSNYLADTNSFTYSQGLVLFQINAGASPLVITEQKLPPNFDTKELFGQKNIPSTLSTIGTIYKLSGESEAKVRYMVTTNDNVLIFISSSDKKASTDILKLIGQLKHYSS